MKKFEDSSVDVVKDNTSTTKTKTITVFHKNQFYTVDQNDVLWFLNLWDEFNRELKATIAKGHIRKKRKAILAVSLIAAAEGLTIYALRKFFCRKYHKK